MNHNARRIRDAYQARYDRLPLEPVKTYTATYINGDGKLRGSGNTVTVGYSSIYLERPNGH